MSNFEHRITEDSTEFEKAFLKIYDGSLWTTLDKMKDWQPPKPQQALPVVPEDVDKAIKYLENNTNSTFSDLCDILTNKGLNWLNDFQFKDRRFGFGGLNNKLFILSHLAITGYQVEKPQLFYLKHIDFCKTDKHYDWFTIKHSDGPLNHLRVEKWEKPSTIDCKFTQQEIDSMQIGSYEQIEVKP